MTADEMFKSMGYKQIKHNVEPIGNNEWVTQDEPYISYTQEDGTAIEEIKFSFYGENVWFKGYRKDWGRLVPCPITMKELQAINKKCEELGWIK